MSELNKDLCDFFNWISSQKTILGLVACNDGRGGRLIAINYSKESTPYETIKSFMEFLKQEDSVESPLPMTEKQFQELVQKINTPEIQSEIRARQNILWNPESFSGYSVSASMREEGTVSYTSLTRPGLEKLRIVFQAAGLGAHIFTTEIPLNIREDDGGITSERGEFMAERDLNFLKEKARELSHT